MTRKTVITQSNRLIEAKYALTLGEQRLILAVIAQIEPGDTDFRDYALHIPTLCQAAGVRNPNWRAEARRIADKLLGRILTLQEPDRTLKIGWISSAEFLHSDPETMQIGFDPKLKPYLLQLKREFTQADLGVVLRLKSVYAIRLYLLLKQYQSIGARTLRLIELRAMLGLPERQYDKYHDFKKRILQPAQAELAAKTEIGFDFHERKDGRAVTAIAFTLRPVAPRPARPPAVRPPRPAPPPAPPRSPAAKTRGQQEVRKLRDLLRPPVAATTRPGL